MFHHIFHLVFCSTAQDGAAGAEDLEPAHAAPLHASLRSTSVTGRSDRAFAQGELSVVEL